MSLCIYCGSPLNDGDAFCTQCGKPITIGSLPQQKDANLSPNNEPPTCCRFCGTPIIKDDLFCTQCGKSINSVEEAQHEERHQKKKPILKYPVFAICASVSAISVVVLLSIMLYYVLRHVETDSKFTQETIDTNKEEVVGLAKQWNNIHSSKNVNDFAAIYASQVEYYGQSYTPKRIIKSKQSLFAKNPEFQQSISNFEVTFIADSCYKIHFDKRVQISVSETSKIYPSYLIVKRINGAWLIIRESDDVTDNNIAKKKKRG